VNPAPSTPDADDQSDVLLEEAAHVLSDFIDLRGSKRPAAVVAKAE